MLLRSAQSNFRTNNLPSPNQIIEILEKAREYNLQDPYRTGHLLTLPNYGQVVMTGDFHGYDVNFEKLKTFADLERYYPRHVVIHELIHSNGSAKNQQQDSSSLLLVKSAQWKIQFPEQVHFILGNHDLAQITSREITKNGAASIASFNRWIEQQFPSHAEKIIQKIKDFLLSIPLAIKCPNKILLAHSLPSDNFVDAFDMTVFEREWKSEDLLPGGSVYEFVWGRTHSKNTLQKLSRKFNVDYFIVGHQKQEKGFSLIENKMIILASDHSMGCFITIDLSKKYTFNELKKRIRSFTELTLPEEK